MEILLSHLLFLVLLKFSYILLTIILIFVNRLKMLRLERAEEAFTFCVKNVFCSTLKILVPKLLSEQRINIKKLCEI